MALQTYIDRLTTSDTGDYFGDEATSESRIFGSAELAEALANTESLVDLPAAFIVQLSDATDEEAFEAGEQLVNQQNFMVMVALDNKLDDRGYAAANTLDIARSVLVVAFHGWESGSILASRYVGGAFEEMNRNVLWWSFEFQVTEELVVP